MIPLSTNLVMILSALYPKRSQHHLNDQSGKYPVSDNSMVKNHDRASLRAALGLVPATLEYPSFSFGLMDRSKIARRNIAHISRCSGVNLGCWSISESISRLSEAPGISEPFNFTEVRCAL